MKYPVLGIWNWYAVGIVISGLEQADPQAMEHLSFPMYVKKQRKLAGRENRWKSEDRGQRKSSKLAGGRAA